MLSIIEKVTNVVTFVQANPVFGGVIGVWALGTLTYVLRLVPSYVYSFFVRQFTIKVTLNNQDEVYKKVVAWYEKEGFSKRTRTLHAQTEYDHNDEEQLSIGAGYGGHWFFFRGRPYYMEREKKDVVGVDKVREAITLATIGRSQKPLRRIIQLATDAEQNKGIKVYGWDHGYWAHRSTQKARSLDSIFIAKDKKKTLLDTLETFKRDEEFYTRNGIPYRLGILLYGPPGTGKSSLVKAISTHIKRDLATINLNVIAETSLEEAFLAAGRKKTLLIEDIDAFLDNEARELDEGSTAKKKKQPPSLSALLNAIDGVGSPDNQIMIITTNDVSSLDKALLRKGRIDLQLEIGYLDIQTAGDMLRSLYKESGESLTYIEEFVRNGTIKPDITGALLQGLVLENRNDVKPVIYRIKG